MRRRLSPHLLPGVALVLIAIAVLVHPELDRPWLSWVGPSPSPGPGATPTATLPPPPVGAPQSTLDEAALTLQNAGAGHGPYAPGGYADRYAAGELPHLSGGAGATYYIATTGSDANPCTLALPCLDPQRFNVGQPAPVLAPGDTVIIEAGTYNLTHVGGPSTGDGLWQLAGVHGAPGNPITFMGQGTVIIQRGFPASDDTQLDRLFTLADTGGQIHDVTFTNLTFVGMVGRGDFNSGDIPGGAAGGDIEFRNGPTFGETWSDNNIIWDHLTFQNVAEGCLKGGNGMTLQYSALSICGVSTLSHMYYDAFGGAKMDHNVFTGTAQSQQVEGQAYYCAPGGSAVASASSTSSVWTFSGSFGDFRAGGFVQITGMSPSAYNGVWQLATASSSVLTVNQPGNPGPSSVGGRVRNTNSGCLITNNVGSNCWYACIFTTGPNTLIQGDVVANSPQCISLGDPDIRASAPITLEQTIIANCSMDPPSGAKTSVALASPGGEVIINNTFFGNNRYAIATANGNMNDVNIYKNNIFAAANTTGTPISYFPGAPGSVEDYNLWWNVAFNTFVGSFVTTMGPHDITADPQFVSAPYVSLVLASSPLPDLHLQAGSPARGAGQNLLGTTDLGAYPYAAGPTALPTAPPSTPGAAGAGSSPHQGHRR